MKLVIALVVVVIIAGGGIWVAKRHNNSSNNSATNTNSSSTSGNTSNNTPTTADATITYDGSNFEPSTLTIKAGQTVKIVNQTTDGNLSFNSNPHPTHTDEPELNAGPIDPGASKTITVTKVGHWGYHNHLNPSQTGTIVVEAK